MVEVITDQLPVRKDSIEELVGHRNRYGETIPDDRKTA